MGTSRISSNLWYCYASETGVFNINEVYIASLSIIYNNKSKPSKWGPYMLSTVQSRNGDKRQILF
jgi:hypothetical protein